jgi:hypothetical protein
MWSNNEDFVSIKAMHNIEQQYYDRITEEIAQGDIKTSLMFRAMAESGDKDEKAQAIYIRLRVAEMKAEAEAKQSSATFQVPAPSSPTPGISPPIPSSPGETDNRKPDTCEPSNDVRQKKQEIGISETNELKGLGGWLILVGIGVVLTPIRNLITLIPYYKQIFTDGTWEVMTTVGSDAYNPLWMPLFIGEFAGNSLIFSVSLLLIYLFFSKNHLFPRFYIGVFIASLIFIFLDTWAFAKIFFDRSIFDPELDPKTVIVFIRTLIEGLIWIPYMLVSKRVKATFIENMSGKRQPRVAHPSTIAHPSTLAERKTTEIYSNPDPTIVGFLKSELDAAGIPCYIRNQYTSGVELIPSVLFWPVLCIIDCADAEEAKTIVAAFMAARKAQKEDGADSSGWVCQKCGEAVPKTFSVCWNCEAPKPES